MDLATVIVSIVGSALASSGAVAGVASVIKDRWMEKVRADYATDLENFKSTLTTEQKRLQARIDRSIFVSRAQFDTEFSAMKDIFRFLTETRHSMEPIRPMIGYANPSRSERERLEELHSQISDLVMRFNALSSQMEALSPFYPKELYEKLVACRKIVAREVHQLRTAGESTYGPQWYIDGSTNQEAFQSAYYQAAVVIRERLDRLSIVTA
jgi:hypothetical protein